MKTKCLFCSRMDLDVDLRFESDSTPSIEKAEEPDLANFSDDGQSDSNDKDQEQDEDAIDDESQADQDEDTPALEEPPPENFSKKETLPEVVQKMTNVNLFIGALKRAGNNDPDVDDSDPGLWFNIPELTESFCGREDFLSQLHDKLQSGQNGPKPGSKSGSKFGSKLVSQLGSKSGSKLESPFESQLRSQFGSKFGSQLEPKSGSQPEVTVLSQVTAVGSSLGGIGKTETAKKYMSKYRPFYNNCIWIDAETENSMRNSFLKLADELEIPVANSAGKPREIQEVVKEIYNKLCEGGKSKPDLIVFDNVEDYGSCHKFLPLGLGQDMKKPVILATSRNQDWISTTGTGKIQIQFLPLDVLTESESLELILKGLEIPEIPEEFREESKELIQLIGGIPLALQQAVAFIKHEKELKKSPGKSYNISDYVRELKCTRNKFKTFSPASNPLFSPPVFLTWNLTFEKLGKLMETGKGAVKILELLSFLYADKIPLSFLQDLVPEMGAGKFSKALKLLEKYSMIKINGNENEKAEHFSMSLRIHRQLQFVILQYLKEYRGVSRVATSLLNKCSGLLQVEDILENSPKSSPLFLNVSQIVANPFNSIPLSEKYLDFLDEFGWLLYDAGQFEESLAVFQSLFKLTVDFLGEDHERALEAEYQVALNLQTLGPGPGPGRQGEAEALALFKENLRKKESHPDFGPDHPETIATKHQIALILRQQKKYGASLLLFQQVAASQKKIHGDSTSQETLAIQDQIALLHSELGNFAKALALYADVERKQSKILGPSHENALIAKQNKATVLYKMGKFEQAATTFSEIHERQKNSLGESHTNTVNTLDWTAKALEEAGKLEQALDLYKKVYDFRQVILDVDHPLTIQTKYNIASLLRQQQKYGESLEMFQQVLVQKNKIHGENHPETFKTQNQIALLHSEQGDCSKALEMLELWENERVQLLGPHHELMLQTKEDKAVVLYGMKRFQEASSLFQEVYERRKVTLGENDKETRKTLEWVTGTKEKQRQLTEALDTWKEVYEVSMCPSLNTNTLVLNDQAL